MKNTLIALFLTLLLALLVSCMATSTPTSTQDDQVASTTNSLPEDETSTPQRITINPVPVEIIETEDGSHIIAPVYPDPPEITISSRNTMPDPADFQPKTPGEICEGVMPPPAPELELPETGLQRADADDQLTMGPDPKINGSVDHGAPW